MFDRPRAGERAVVVHVQAPGPDDVEGAAELKELALSAGAAVVASCAVRLRTPDARTLIGAGKLEEIASAVNEHAAELVIVNRALSPAQERNLEQSLRCRVVDRIGLILDIFAQRASTFEGKLQVELAQLRHLATRLVRGWTHLERQKGGIGLRGPGETQLETDRRLVNDRIKRIEQRLERVSKRRSLSRRARARADVPVVSLVGYTNAGKSTLFNALTGEDIYAADKLFATLDPTLRRVVLSAGTQPVVLADTVGFIRDLPPELVAAFRATLEETRAASLLVHVVDASAEDPVQKKTEVNAVLDRIGAGELPQIEVYNKIDAMTPPRPAQLDRAVNGCAGRVWVSARAGEGLDLLRTLLAERVHGERVAMTIRVAASDGRTRARVFEVATVTAERVTGDGTLELDVIAPPAELERLCKQQGVARASMTSSSSAA